MKNKSDVVTVLNAFSAMVETQYKTQILCFRTHNTKELVEGDILE